MPYLPLSQAAALLRRTKDALKKAGEQGRHARISDPKRPINYLYWVPEADDDGEMVREAGVCVGGGGDGGGRERAPGEAEGLDRGFDPTRGEPRDGPPGRAGRDSDRGPEEVEWEERTPALLETAGVEMWAVCSDVHVPDHDPRAWRAFLDFVADQQPHGVCINGDFAELTSFSSHGDLVNPGYWREERDSVRRELHRLRKAAPGARMVYNAGNHEQRLDRSHARNNPALAGSDPWYEQFNLRDLGIEHRAEGDPLRLGRLRVVHGKWAPVNAAKKHLEKLGSCLVGHVHRPGMHSGGYDHKTQIGWVAPCLRSLDAGYLNGYDAASGWALGFAIVHVFGDQSFNCELVVMTPDRKFAYGGKVYG